LGVESFFLPSAIINGG